MGFFKKLFGFEKQAEDEEAAQAGAGGGEKLVTLHPSESAAKVDRERAERLGINKHGRPALAEAPPPSQSIDDVLELREAGDRKAARKLLAEIDKGGGLRTVLHAAAAIEDGDEATAKKLVVAIEDEANGWKLLLQTAAALGDDAKATPLVDAAEKSGAPGWAIAWTRATSKDDATRRRGLVDLLFDDAALARTVAARDLAIEGAANDPEAGARYAAFAHGRDSIRRFGAELVATTIERARTR